MEWLTIRTVAELEGVTTRAIRKRINSNQYTIRRTNGVGGKSGIQYELLFDSLSLEAQARYYGEESKRQQSAYMSLAADQRAIVDFKYAVVLKYVEFKKVYSKSDKMCVFLAQYNQEHPAGPLTRRQVNHYIKGYFTGLCMQLMMRFVIRIQTIRCYCWPLD